VFHSGSYILIMKEQNNPCDTCNYIDATIKHILLCKYYEDNPNKVCSPCVVKCPCDNNSRSLSDIMSCPFFVSDPNEDDPNKGNPDCAGKYDNDESSARALYLSRASSTGERVYSCRQSLENTA